MNRRTLLKQAAAIPLLAANGPSGISRRRLRPGNPSWPSAAEWDGLKQAVDGRLLKVEPPLAACVGAPDSMPCGDVLKALCNPFFIGEQAGATQSSGWVDAWIREQTG